MRKLTLVLFLFVLFISQSALAQLEPFKDYEVSDRVWVVTTVKVDSNFGDHYLEKLRGTWVKANEVAKELGQLSDYGIYRSQTPNSGDFNLILVVEFENSEMLEPNKERYEAFMKAWGEANRAHTEEVIKEYPNIRKITGDYIMRKIDIK